MNVFTSFGSVAVLLIWVLLMENNRRGLFFGAKAPVGKRVLEFARKYHGYYFGWAILYTFWFHPAEATSGHLVGFFYTLLLMLQGSLFFTRVHINKWWTLTQEVLVVAHGTMVALMQSQTGWTMFLFGFTAIFIVTQMPPVIKGFLVAGILAAAMSSLASAMTAISSVAIMDLWRPLTGKTGEQKGELAMGRWGTLAVGVVLVLIAWVAKDAELIFNLVFQFAGIFAGALLGAVLYGMWAKAGHSGPVMTGMVVSSVIMAIIVALTKLTAFNINWPWYSAIGTSICLGTIHLLSIGKEKPTDRSIEMVAPDET